MLSLYFFPGTLQSDCGKEFYGEVKKLCQNAKIKRIRSRPYHPQSQGKVERTHRELRKKISYDLIKRGKKGLNWAKDITNYMKTLNNEKREELGWRSPFEVYYGRKSNELLKCGFPKDTEDCVPHQKVKSPSRRQVRDHLTEVRKTRKKAKECTQKINERTIKYHRKKYKCAQYNKGDQVFINFSKKGGKGYKTRHVILGQVLKKGNDGDRYYLKFTNPTSEEVERKWYSVEDLAGSNCESNQARKSKKAHRKKYLIPLSKQNRIDTFTDQGYTLTYDPPGDGNCQFHAVARALATFGMYRSAHTLRNDVVRYLSENENDQDGWPLELFMGMPMSEYISEMARDATYGDHLTLRAMANLFNIQITVVSTIGADGLVNISPSTEQPIGRITLGHFAEGDGDHYVLLNNIERDEDNIDFVVEDAQVRFFH